MKQGWKTFWEMYLMYFGVTMVIKTIGFFDPKSQVQFYFTFLTNFNDRFLFNYLMNAGEIIFSWIQVIVIGLYVYDKKILPQKFWQVLFIFKIFLFAFGNTYQNYFLMSAFYENKLIFLWAFLLTFLPIIPAYWAWWKYAFTRR